MAIKICFVVFLDTVRLRGGRIPNEGRIELFVAEKTKWMSLCSDNWRQQEAEVACRSLGFPAPTWVYEYSPFYENMEYFAKPKNCTGTEASLHDCAVTDKNYCWKTGYPASVVCGKPSGKETIIKNVVLYAVCKK